MSPDKDPARKRRIRSKAARLRRRSAPGAAPDDRPAPPAEPRRPAVPVPTTAETAPGGAAAGPPPLPVRGAAAGRPPLPVRGAAPVPAHAGADASDNPTVPPPFPALSPLSAEELLADRPSLDMLRRVRRGLRALPESDGHLPD